MKLEFIKKVSQDESLSRASLLLLWYFKNNKITTKKQEEIAKELGLNVFTVGENISTLAKSGYIRREIPKRDSRRRRIIFIK